MKLYNTILTRKGHLRNCRLCDHTARVRPSGGGHVYCLDHYLIEVGKTCSLGGQIERLKVETISIIGIWLTASLRMGFARQLVLESYPKAFDNERRLH